MGPHAEHSLPVAGRPRPVKTIEVLDEREKKKHRHGPPAKPAGPGSSGTSVSTCSRLFPSPRSRGEGQGEGQQQPREGRPLAWSFVDGPLKNPEQRAADAVDVRENLGIVNANDAEPHGVQSCHAVRIGGHF